MTSETGSEVRVTYQEPSEESLSRKRKWTTVWNIANILSKKMNKTWPRFSNMGTIVDFDKNSSRRGKDKSLYGVYITENGRGQIEPSFPWDPVILYTFVTSFPIIIIGLYFYLLNWFVSNLIAEPCSPSSILYTWHKLGIH